MDDEKHSIVYCFSPLVLLLGEDEHNQTDLAVLGQNRNDSQAAEIIGKLYISTEGSRRREIKIT